MPEYKVGDKVRINDDAWADGWLSPGQVGTISQILGRELFFANPEENGGRTSLYFNSEIEHVAEEPAYGTPEPVSDLDAATKVFLTKYGQQPVVDLRVVALEAASRALGGISRPVGGYEAPHTPEAFLNYANKFYDWLTKEDA